MTCQQPKCRCANVTATWMVYKILCVWPLSQIMVAEKSSRRKGIAAAALRIALAYAIAELVRRGALLVATLVTSGTGI